ncbi:MAG TPA: tryptophan synthase subunit alpha [Polyangiaceae bacterium]|jgi:tryptophan synthase alpha chain|nr:tryptophan synthase subunit alpha [Polyangiaceae bacterium]
MTVLRIEQRLSALRAEGRTALVIYLTIGDPSIEDSIASALAAARAGADLLEIGVPFSDPTADGPVIAAASYRAIKSGGGSFSAALRAVEAIRRESQIPIILFSYYNPLLAFGDERAADEALRVGADGFLVVDLPPEEGALLRARAKKNELAIVPLVAPTTGLDREPALLEGASGFVYYVSVTGITGTSAAPLQEAGERAADLRKRAKLPVVIGFGIRTPADAERAAASGADGVVVGTEVVRTIAAAGSSEARVSAVEALVSALRAGLDAKPRS